MTTLLYQYKTKKGTVKKNKNDERKYKIAVSFHVLVIGIQCILPALIYVAASNCISCVEASYMVNFYYFDAASIVVKRLCFL